MRSLPILGLGVFFVLAGIGLVLFTLRKTAAATKPGVPLKKSELRDLEAAKSAHQTETTKLRIAGGIALAVGVALMALS